mgnify:CR=1 FL=1|tara:strand:+ start:1283 stop:1456 length:174 start_codon:yes stop_codon:yes gene_type:complete
MLEMLLYANLTCTQVDNLISNVKEFSYIDNTLDDESVNEVIEVIKEAMPECFNERSK